MPGAPAAASSPSRGGSPKGPTTDFKLLSSEKLRLCGAAVTRIDGVVVGTYVGSGSPVPEEFLRQAAKVLALVSQRQVTKVTSCRHQKWNGGPLTETSTIHHPTALRPAPDLAVGDQVL